MPIDDGGLNWIPVQDPTGQYVAHIENLGHSAIHLLERSTGRDLGRLVPDVTQIHYLDWK